jgi:hypothetical protein
MLKVATAPAEGKPQAGQVKLLKRIGSATVEITVHFSKEETETLEDKLLRLLEREVRNGA